MFRTYVASTILLIGTVAIAQSSAAADATRTTTSSGATIVTSDRGPATIHTFVSGEDSVSVTSHVIETEEALVVVDAQILPHYVEESKAYADSLGKPIDRLVISHAHPDHYIGTEAFVDVPVHATQDTTAAIEATGQATIDAYGIPATAVVPTNTITEGSEVIDGLTYEYRIVRDAEADETLVLLLPEAGTIIPQDLIFNGLHAYLGNGTPAGWRAAVDELEALGDTYEYIPAGHGLPAGREIFESMDAYLAVAEQAFDSEDTPQGVIDTIREAFPDLGGANVLANSVNTAFANE